ncbi:MAG: AMP-binding protein, partial [Pseudomonadota bacterium]
ETTIGGLLRAAANESGGDPALVEIDIDGVPQRRWTWAEMLRDAEELALALASRFAPGERLTVWSPNTPEWVLMEHACGLAGLVLVTANPAYQTSELRYVLEQSHSVALFYVKTYRGNPMDRIAQDACHGLSAIREMVDMDDPEQRLATGNRPAALPDVLPNDAAMIQYTSGTTGFPKGAVLSHRSLTNNARLFMDRTGTTKQSVWANFMPMFHTSGCGMIALGTLQTHAPMLIFKIFDPVAILRLIPEERIATFIGVPTMMVAMLECMEHQPTDTSSVEVAISGGSMVAPELVRNVQEAVGCAFQTVYGQTECSPLITQHHLGETLEDICTTIGQPMPQTEVAIHEVGTGRTAPIGEQGEICVRGYCNMLEYNDNPDATSATIDGDGWLHTGDLGTMDARGYLKITGRVKEMIIRGGENLFPAEIENVLLEHPSVAECAVVGLPDEKWGEIVACFARPEPGMALDAGELRSWCRQHLAPMKTPVVWCQVKDFPLTGSGKIQKFALRDLFVAGEIPEL